MSENRLVQFAGQKYLNLESYRKNGQGVRTPLWFAEENGAFYVYTLADSWKVKRIRNNSQVKIVPSDVRGNPRGDWIPATARILDLADGPQIHALLRRKYGWQKIVGEFFNRFRKRAYAYLEVRPD